SRRRVRADLPRRDAAARDAGRDRRLRARLQPDARRLRDAADPGRNRDQVRLGGRLHRCAGPVQPAARDGVVGGAAGRGAAGLCDPEAPDPSLRGIRMNGSRPFRVARVLAAALVYGFLLGPMLVVALFSFSDKSFFTFPPSGFSLRWYRAAWESGLFLDPAVRSLALAALSTLIAA